MQDVVELKDGARKTVSKKMFPGYVLLNMEMNDDTWYDSLFCASLISSAYRLLMSGMKSVSYMKNAHFLISLQNADF